MITTSKGFKKPAATEAYNLQTWNDNMDKANELILALEGVDASKAPIASPTFTGIPKAPTPAAGTNTTQVATTAFVKKEITDQGAATLVSPAFTGAPTAPTPSTGDSSTKLATTAFVNNEIANDAILKTGGTLTGPLTAANSSIFTPYVRNAVISTSAPSGGNNGDIWFQYV